MKPKIKNYIDIQDLIRYLVSELNVSEEEIHKAINPENQIYNHELISGIVAEDIQENLENYRGINAVKILKKINEEFPNEKIYYWW